MLPQCDRSLHEERPHNTTFYASRANTVRPYGYTFADGLHGGVRAEGELPARAREATLVCPALRIWYTGYLACSMAFSKSRVPV